MPGFAAVYLAASFTDGEGGEIFGSKCFGGRVRSFQGHPTHCGKRPCAAMGCAAAPGFKPAPQIAGAAMRPIAAGPAPRRGRSHTEGVFLSDHLTVVWSSGSANSWFEAKILGPLCGPSRRKAAPTRIACARRITESSANVPLPDHRPVSPSNALSNPASASTSFCRRCSIQA